MAEEESKDTPLVCKGCVIWEKFGRSCYYFWENKKHCTMYAADWNEAAEKQPLF